MPSSPAVSASRTKTLGRFIRFGIVGTAGLLWDISIVYALTPVIGLIAATLVAYLVAATMNWITNRLWTFRDAGNSEHPVLQWLRFLSANSLGFLLNRGTVYLLFWLNPIFIEHKFLALAAGSLAGLFANFNLSQKLVFRERAPDSLLELAEISTGMIDPECPESAVATVNKEGATPIPRP